MKRATIHDVAKEAGVSIKTVSRVLNKEPNVRPETHDKVADAIRKFRYRPSTSARGLAGSRSYLIGLLYDNPSASYITNIQRGVLDASQEEDYGLLIHPCEYTTDGLKQDILDFVAHTRVDGLILTPPVTDQPAILDALTERKIPKVMIAPAEGDNNPWSVRTNDRGVCSEMVEYLHSLGHERIAFILGHPDHKAIEDRYAGYLEGMSQCGLKTSKSLQIQGYNSFESGMECGRKLLRRKNPPTAIFASNDDMAAGVIRVANEMGLSIPDDVSVAGFDDIPLARQVWPSLTTVHQPVNQMAETATRLLIRKLRGQDPNGIEREIPSRLVIRRSTGPAPSPAH